MKKSIIITVLITIAHLSYAQWIPGPFGIGTDSPDYTLDVEGTINADTILVDGIPLKKSPWATDTLGIHYTNGHVGIGTSNPESELEVVGIVKATSFSTGTSNTFVGKFAGVSNTFLGIENTFVGISAGAANTIGRYNIFLGNKAGYSNTTGNSNIFTGVKAGYFNTTGNGNTFTGSHAGYANTTGKANTFVGDRTGYSNTTGSNNTYVGLRAGAGNTTGADNVCLGADAGHSNTAGSRNVFLGYRAGYYETGSNKLYIANSDTLSPLVLGDFASGVLTVNGKLGIGNNTPVHALEVAGTINTDTLLIGGVPVKESLWTPDTAGIHYINGNVGIGTTVTGSHKLAVEGSIGARQVQVEASGWSDFVFEEGYNLRSLEEVEGYIAENNHLPEIPGEAEVMEKGINLGAMDARLLQKIEELTLYLIEQNKALKVQQAQNEAQQAQIAHLVSKLETLKDK